MSENFQSIVHMLARELFDTYETFKFSSIISNRFTQAEMLNWIKTFEDSKLFEKEEQGRSAEGRIINLYKIGDGPTNILIWSQMHGDESTATMALLDIFAFMTKNPEHTITKNIKKELRLLIIPMLNPDGAERWSRYNAQMIDINRDALAQVTPEAKILSTAHKKFKPEYGFNLHDQPPRLTVGTTKKNTAIALLAPAIDEHCSDDVVRIKAKKVASLFAQIMQQFIPGHIAKWDDTFEPRAFGDNIQKSGTSTILIESGGWKNDPCKFFIRKLNCIGLLVSLYAIAIEETTTVEIEPYEQLLFNAELGYDCIIRNASLKANDKVASVKIDIGINYDTKFNELTSEVETYAKIVEIGDLRNFISIEKEIDAKGKLLKTERIILDQPFPLEEIDLLLKNI